MRIYRYLLSGVVLLSAAVTISCVSTAMQPSIDEEAGHPELIAAVDDLVRTLMRKNHIPGLSIALVSGQSVLVRRGYGFADRDNRVPATPDTIFRAYSIAKVFTALETVRLAEDGLVSLDDPIGAVLPEWPDIRRIDPSGPVTLRNLLAHRAGLPRNSNYHESLAVAKADCLRLQVRSLAEAWAAFPVAYRYKYSNIGFNVLGRLIEVERDQPFAVYMTDLALPAYGMDESSYLLSFLPSDSVVATGYEHYRGRCYARSPYDIIGLASGNLYTSAEDLSAFMIRALTGPSEVDSLPIAHETLLSMFAPQFTRSSDLERNGLGWMTSEEMMGELMAWHQGGDYDANALVAMLPRSRLAICILTNCGSFEGTELYFLAVDAFRAVRDHESLDSPESTVASNPSLPISNRVAPPAVPELERIAGRYIAYGEILELFLSGDDLRARIGPARLRLRWVGQNALGEVYSLHHWLDSLSPGSLFPVDLSLMRLIVPPAPAMKQDHIIIAISDVSYEFCPSYPDTGDTPASWAAVAGDYDNCSVIVDDRALRMTGVGYLVQRSSNVFEVVDGPYAGETVIRNPQTRSLFHQGFEYMRR